MVDIRHKVGISASKEDVYKALTSEQGLSNWWTHDTKADQHQGGKIEFSFSKRLDKEYDVLVEITELNPGKKVHWKILEGPEEWRGTEITFDIDPQENETLVHFSHKNWGGYTDFMSQCNTKWAVFLLSLKDLVETGKGHPFPEDIRIGHYGA